MSATTYEVQKTGGAHGGVARALPSLAVPLVGVAVLGLLIAAIDVFVSIEWYPVRVLLYWPLLDLRTASINASRVITFGGLWVIQFALYYAAYRLCPRERNPLLLALILGLTVVFNLALLQMDPVTDGDIFDYVVQGRLGSWHHVNPYTTDPSTFPDKFLTFAYWKHLPASYGPLWQQLAQLATRLAKNDLARNIFAFRLVAIFHMWGAIGVLYLLLRRLHPAHVNRGILLFAWNPLLQLEGTVQGHNDLVLIFWLLLALYLFLERRHLLALIALTASVLVKFVPILLLPLFLLAMRRDHSDLDRNRMLRVFAYGLGAMAVFAFLMYVPFGYRGVLATFGFVSERTGLVLNSPLALLGSVMYRVLHVPIPTTNHTQSVISYLLLAGILVWQVARFVRTRTADHRQNFMLLVECSFELFFFDLLVAILWFWPWYVLWIVALAPLLPRPGFALRMSVFSCGAFVVNLTWGAISQTDYYWPVWRGLWMTGLSQLPALLVTLAAVLYVRHRSRSSHAAPPAGQTAA